MLHPQDSIESVEDWDPNTSPDSSIFVVENSLLVFEDSLSNLSIKDNFYDDHIRVKKVLAQRRLTLSSTLVTLTEGDLEHWSGER